MSTREPGVPPLDDILRWVVVGFRIVSIVWMGALVGATLASDSGADRAVVAGTYALAVAWTALTVAHAARPRWFRTLAWVAVDGLVAMWVSVAPFVAGSRDLFFGGYPLSWVLMAAYASGPWPALGSAAMVAAGQVIGAFGKAGRTPTRVAGDVGVYLAAALAAGWSAHALRRFDLLRTQALEALEEERRARMQAHDRAEIAAHLHDSVLQTLALIEQNAGDPRKVTSLAHGQERELRQWIDQIASPHTRSFRAALRRTAGEVEDLFMIKVDAVVVGDCELEPPLEALVQAAREALVNAARFSGADLFSLFAEVGDGGITVSVRDRGRGFDPAAVTPGSRGLAHSIIGRMERHGGSATVRSAPGEGTEIELHMGRGDG